MAPGRSSSSHLVVLFSLAFFFALWVPSSAQSNSVAGCLPSLLSLTPCLSFVNGSSATPASGCCSALTNVVNSNPQCLCTLIDGGSVGGNTINKTLALALPAACNVAAPAVSQCNGGNSAPPPNSPPSAGGSPSAGGQSSPTSPSGSGSPPPPPPPPPRSSAAAGGGFGRAASGVLLTGVLLSLRGIGIGFN